MVVPTASAPEVDRADAPPREGAPGRFRHDIQGLRAFAVTAVVVYHLWPERLPGGFVGVDVFFVISGYLITSHLVREIQRTGRVDLLAFWARRIRRLLPAAFLVLATSAAAVLALMPTLTWAQNARDLAASALYVENWNLGRAAVDYLAREDVPSVAQHYWSLSVEEQFYVLWPLLLVAAVWAGTRWARLSVRASAVAVMAVVASVSLGVSVVLSASNAPFAFFATQTRVWEFAVGGLLGLLPVWGRGATARAVVAWLGLGLMTVSLLVLGRGEPFPGVAALLPVAGAACVIGSGPTGQPWAASSLASWAPVQWLGGVSYSVYLWHWPLVVVAPWVLHTALTWPAKLVVLALSLVLGHATKRWVEDPARTARWWSGRRMPAYAFTAAGMALVLALTGVASRAASASVREGQEADRVAAVALAGCFGEAALQQPQACPSPFRRPSEDQLASAATDVGVQATCQTSASSSRLELCRAGRTASPSRVVVLVGNSHALRLYPALAAYAQTRGWEVDLAAKTDCLGVVTRPVGRLAPGDPCLEWSTRLQEALLALPRLDAVVFASHVSARQFLAGSDADDVAVASAGTQVLDTWRQLAARGVKVVVTGDVPGTRPDPAPACIARSRETDDPCAIPASDVLRSNELVDLATDHPDLVTLFPLSPYVCDAEVCHAAIGGLPVYSDTHHLTTTFSRTLAPYLGGRLDAVLTSRGER